MFLFQERAYKLIPHVEQLAIHFQVDGNLIHKESDEAKRQIQIRKDIPGLKNPLKDCFKNILELLSCISLIIRFVRTRGKGV